MHLKWPLRIPGLNLKEERKGEWEGGRERKGEKEGRRGDGGEERKKRRDGRRHQLTKKKNLTLPHASNSLLPTILLHNAVTLNYFQVLLLGLCLNVPFSQKPPPIPHVLVQVPFKCSHRIHQIFVLYSNCPCAYLSLNLDISPPRSRSVSIMFLVISPGPSLIPAWHMAWAP